MCTELKAPVQAKQSPDSLRLFGKQKGLVETGRKEGLSMGVSELVSQPFFCPAV